MTEPRDAQLPPEPHEGIDASHNADARAYEQNQSSAVARAADSGPPPTDAPPKDQAPALAGTGAGDPLAGVTMNEQDAQDAVSGDLGPEHPAVRRNS